MFRVNQYTGEVAVSTSDRSLHQSYFHMALTCRSTENGFQTTDTFTVTFEDACLTTSFIWPTFNTINIDLYDNGVQEIPLATTVVLGCEPVSYSIFEITPDDNFVGTIPDF